MNATTSSPLRGAAVQGRGMSGPGVLIAEDDSTLRAIMVDTLRQEGFNRVYEATDGAVCLTTLKQNAGSIKVLVLDLMMPNQSGAHVMDTLYQQNPTGLGVLLISGHEDSLSAIESKYRTARVNFRVESLLKPFDNDQLVSRIKGLLLQLGGPSALAGIGKGKGGAAQTAPTGATPLPGQSPQLQRTQVAPAPAPQPTVTPTSAQPAVAPLPSPPPPQPQVSAAQRVVSTTDLHRLQKQLASVEGQLAGLNSAVAELRKIISELSA